MYKRQGAARVIGIDPSARFVMQFEAIRRYAGSAPVDVLLSLIHI